MENYNKNIRPWLGILALFIIGGMMVANPDMYNEVEVEGRKAFTKLIFSYIWGLPAGIICILIGAYMAYNQITGKKKEGEEA